MKIFRAKTIPELRRFRGISMDQIKEIMSKQTYYDWINGKSNPKKQETIDKFCELFEIDEKTFRRLLKNSIS